MLYILLTFSQLSLLLFSLHNSVVGYFDYRVKPNIADAEHVVRNFMHSTKKVNKQGVSQTGSRAGHGRGLGNATILPYYTFTAFFGNFYNKRELI